MKGINSPRYIVFNSGFYKKVKKVQALFAWIFIITGFLFKKVK